MGLKVLKFATFAESMEKKAQAMIVKAAANSAEYMYSEFIRAIDFFYDSYDPIHYKRHYYMDLGGLPYTRSYKGGKQFGGVQLNSDAIPSVYHDDPSYVFFQSTMQGWHGGHGIFSTPSPMQMLYEAVAIAGENPAAFLR